MRSDCPQLLQKPTLHEALTVTGERRARVPLSWKTPVTVLIQLIKETDLVQLNAFALPCRKSGMLVILHGWSELSAGGDQPVITKIGKEQRFVMNDKPLSGNLIWSN